MDVLKKSMSGQVKIDNTLKEEFIKILGYIASMSFLLMVFLSIVYIFMPQANQDFVGIKVDFPHVDEINGILRFTVHSISNVFTYVFLSVVGIVSFLGAQYLEDSIEQALEEEEGKAEHREEEKAKKLKIDKKRAKAVEVVKSETIIKEKKPEPKPKIQLEPEHKLELDKNVEKSGVVKTSPKFIVMDEQKQTKKLDDEDKKLIDLGKSLREILMKKRR